MAGGPEIRIVREGTPLEVTASKGTKIEVETDGEVTLKQPKRGILRRGVDSLLGRTPKPVTVTTESKGGTVVNLPERGKVTVNGDNVKVAA